MTGCSSNAGVNRCVIGMCCYCVVSNCYKVK